MFFRLLIISIIFYITKETSVSISKSLGFILNPTYTVIIINFLLIISITLYLYHIINNKIKKFDSWIELRLNKLFKKSISDINNSKKWGDIVSLLETTHHTSIIARIKKLESEDKINLPKFIFDFHFNRNFLHRIREFVVLFESILEKMKHESFYEGDNKDNKREIEKQKEEIKDKLELIYLLKYKYKLYLQFYNIFYLIIPFFIAIFLSFIVSTINNNLSHFYFFLGVSLIFLLYPLLNIVDSLINLFVIKKHTKPNIIIKSFYILFASFTLTLVTFYGIYLINLTDEPFSHIFHFFKSTVFDENIQGLNFILNSDVLKKFQGDITSYLFFIKIIILFTLTVMIYYIINHSIDEYDQFYYEQKIKKYLLPPDLLKIISMVILTIVSIAYLYINLSLTPKIAEVTKNESNSNPSLMKKECKKIEEKLVTMKEEAKGMENLLPFSIFLALLGTLLAISTKDIMENYFTGLSLKVNSPYEEGDRIKIENYGILEVREIGTRSDEFYEIETNSIIVIPHKRLSQIDIKNYTKPTLDYREEISIYIEKKKLINGNVPRESEKLLLLSAFINTGVKIPKIKDELKDELKIFLDSYRKYSKEKETYKELEEDEEFEKIINETWKKIEAKNTKENKLFENLFISKLTFNLINQNIEKGLITEEQKTIFLIRKSILAIINSVIEYQERKSTLNIHADKNGIRRKYKIFNNIENTELDIFATVLVNISFYYYMLSNRLWELKEQQNSLIQKRKIDKAMTEILTVPKITSSQYLDNATLYWKSTLLVTLELSEEGKETIHHINMYIDELWDRILQY